MAQASEEASLLEGNFSAVVYSHLGSMGWFVLRALITLQVNLAMTSTLSSAINP